MDAVKVVVPPARKHFLETAKESEF